MTTALTAEELKERLRRLREDPKRDPVEMDEEEELRVFAEESDPLGPGPSADYEMSEDEAAYRETEADLGDPEAEPFTMPMESSSRIGGTREVPVDLTPRTSRKGGELPKAYSPPIDGEALSADIMAGLEADDLLDPEAPTYDRNTDPTAVEAVRGVPAEEYDRNLDPAVAERARDDFGSMNFTEEEADQARVDSGVDAPGYTPAIDGGALSDDIMAGLEASGRLEAEGPADMTFTEEELYPADDNEAVEASMGIDDDESAEPPPADMTFTEEELYPPPDDEAAMAAFDAENGAGEVYPMGEGFNDPQLDAGMPAEAPPEPGDMTDFDGMSAALDGRIFEDGTVDYERGIPGYDERDAAEPPPDDPEAMAAFDASEFPDEGMAYGNVEELDAPDEDVLAALSAEPGGAELASPSKSPDAGDPSRRLDAGLPSEGDISSARDWDVVRQIMGRIGNAFGGAAGRPMREIDQQAPELTETRREGIESRLATKGENEAAGRTAAATAEHEARLERSAERTAELTGRRLDITEATEGRRGGLAERELANEEAMDLPASPVSAQARERLNAELDAMAEGNPTMARMAERYRARVPGMSANDVAALEDTLGITTRPATGRGNGGGGGGAGGAERDAAMRRALLASGRVTEENVDTVMAALPRRSEEMIVRGGFDGNTDTAVAGPAAEGGDAMVYIDGPDGIPRAIRGLLEMSPPARRTFVADHNAMMSAGGSLRTLEGITRDRSAVERAISTETAAAIAPALMEMRAVAARIQGTGVINPSEMAAINAALPDPTSLRGMTFGAFQSALNAWRSSIARHMNTAMESSGIARDDRAYVIRRAVGSGSAESAESAPARSAPAAAPTGEVVRMRRPDGTTRRVPSANAAAAEAAGWERVE